MKTTLSEIQKLIDKLALQIQVPQYLLPTFEHTSEGSYIEIDRSGLLYYFETERGKEILRYIAKDADDLLYKVFDGPTLMMASDYELKNRTKGQDSRRIMFSEQERLLGMLFDNWKSRKAKEHEQILTNHPFDDYASERATYYQAIVKGGQNQGDEWLLACEKYPLPK
jgi:hypothetical protein